MCPRREVDLRRQSGISNDEYYLLSESDEIPKKRGRPKKIKQFMISDDEYDPVSESDESPKKRGRPKKKQVEISGEKGNLVSKARSLPSNLKNPIKSDTSIPRKRGRPKKIIRNRELTHNCQSQKQLPNLLQVV
jgi:AT hook motif